MVDSAALKSSKIPGSHRGFCFENTSHYRQMRQMRGLSKVRNPLIHMEKSVITNGTERYSLVLKDKESPCKKRLVRKSDFWGIWVAIWVARKFHLGSTGTPVGRFDIPYVFVSSLHAIFRFLSCVFANRSVRVCKNRRSIFVRYRVDTTV